MYIYIFIDYLKKNINNIIKLEILIIWFDFINYFKMEMYKKLLFFVKNCDKDNND